MADTLIEGNGGSWGPHGQAIRDTALEVLELANDLRALEVLDHWGWGVDDVADQGDTGRDAILRRVGDTHRGLLLAQEQEEGFQLGSEFARIPEVFAKYAVGCDLAGHQTAQADLTAAGEILTASGDALMDPIRHRLSEALWAGSAADVFRDEVLDPMNDVGPNQQRAIAELTGALNGHANLVVAAQQGALNIATLTKQALEAAIAAKAPPEPTTMFAVIGTALAFGSIFVPGTQGFALVLALLNTSLAASQLAYTATQTTNPQPVDSTIGGDTAHMIIFSMQVALIALDAAVTAEEVELARKLDETTANFEAMLASPKRSRYIRAARVSIADDAPSKNEFRHRG
ncbi:hypothetical protein AB0I28_21765 [Phytomonospora sp. NPDC050363]|uniref:hypothetical protein n=1 Tax=Phytomonospora sp. NPDC050363 TaxID=3155642 RepID=UPI003411EC82